MTPIMVLLSIVFGIMISESGKKKIKRSSEILSEESAKGLKEVFSYLQDEKKICRYFFSGSLKEKVICENEFECADCFIHQKLKEIDISGNYPVKKEKISGMTFNSCYFYHRGHTWANVEKNGYVKIGFDPLIKNVFKNCEKIMLLEKGEFVEMGEICSSFQIRGNMYPTLSPISGEIVKLNESVLTEINSSSFEFPWVYIIKPFHLSVDLQKLLYGKEAVNWFRYEVESFLKELSGGKEFAADGGEMDFGGLEVNFKEFTESFLISLKNKKGGIS